MDEDINVTQVGAAWGRVKHRSCKIKRCANGYIVDYERMNQEPHEPGDVFNRTVQETRVFICNDALRRFLDEYFHDEPKP